MATGKRPVEYIEIDDSDTEDEAPARPAKFTRTTGTDAGTYMAPIDLSHPYPSEQLTLDPGMLAMMDDGWRGFGFEPLNAQDYADLGIPMPNPTTPGLSVPLDHDMLSAMSRDGFQQIPDPDPSLLVDPRLTEDECLLRVLDLFPDVEHDHVLKLARGNGNALTLIIEDLMQSGYPKEVDGLAAKQREEAAKAAEQQRTLESEGPVPVSTRKAM